MITSIKTWLQIQSDSEVVEVEILMWIIDVRNISTYDRPNGNLHTASYLKAFPNDISEVVKEIT